MIFLLNRLKEAKALTNEEREFLEDLLSKNKPIFLHVIKIATGDLYDVFGDECLSELHCLSIRKIKNLMSVENPKRWLTTASKYIAIEFVRRYGNGRGSVPIDDVADQLANDDVFEEARYNILMREFTLDKIMNKLTKRQKQIFEMMIVQKMSCEEVSRKLNISESTVWNTRASLVKRVEEIIKNDL